MKICPHCGASLSDSETFCRSCGRTLASRQVSAGRIWICSNCGANIKQGETFCRGCGRRLLNRQGGYQQPYRSQSNDENMIAIIGFILSFFIAIAGLVCSIIGYIKSNECGGTNRGLALAGIIISAISLCGGVIILFSTWSLFFYI